MLTNKQKLKKEKEKNRRLLNMIADERAKVAGYEQIAKVHSAYISILLIELGATKDNMITITASEVKEALEKYETRAIQVDGGYSLYFEGYKGDNEDGVQTKVTTAKRAEKN